MQGTPIPQQKKASGKRIARKRTNGILTEKEEKNVHSCSVTRAPRRSQNCGLCLKKKKQRGPLEKFGRVLSVGKKTSKPIWKTGAKTSPKEEGRKQRKIGSPDGIAFGKSFKGFAES